MLNAHKLKQNEKTNSTILFTLYLAFIYSFLFLTQMEANCPNTSSANLIVHFIQGLDYFLKKKYKKWAAEKEKVGDKDEVIKWKKN